MLVQSCDVPYEAHFFVAQVNATEKDKTQQAKLRKRSLALLGVELAEKKLATSAALRGEYQKRASNNIRGSDILKKHQMLWSYVGGPKPEFLINPDTATLDDARKCAQVLQKMPVDEQQAPDGLSAC